MSSLAGLVHFFGNVDPPLKRWAILCRPSAGLKPNRDLCNKQNSLKSPVFASKNPSRRCLKGPNFGNRGSDRFANAENGCRKSYRPLRFFDGRMSPFQSQGGCVAHSRQDPVGVCQPRAAHCRKTRFALTQAGLFRPFRRRMVKCLIPVRGQFLLVLCGRVLV